LGNLAAAADATHPRYGTAAAALGNLAGSASGSFISGLSGTADAVLGAMQASVVGFVAPAGSADGTLAAMLGAAVGAHAISGTVDATLGNLSGSATGLVPSVVSGSADALLGQMQAAAIGLLVPSGSGAGSLGKLQGAAIATAGHLWQPYQTRLLGSFGRRPLHGSARKKALIGSTGTGRHLRGS
jgi:hypothetical protein